MKKLESNIYNIIKYIVLTIGTLFFLFLADLFVLAYIQAGDSKENVNVEYVADSLEKRLDEGGTVCYELTQESKNYVDEHNGFVFLMDNNGSVLWEYHMPKELPRQYTIEDAVKFSRYYLQDYPVYTHITDEGIVVLGTEKGKTWRYTLTYQGTTVIAYFYGLPLLLIGNIAVLILVLFITIKHDHRRREMERTTWIAGVSHDIRTPLSLVIGYADEILHIVQEKDEKVFDKKMTDVSENSDGIFRRAHAIEEQAVRIKNLVTNLNTENKLTYGMGSWKKEPILLSAVIRDTICEMLNRNMDEKYDIRVSISEELESLSVKGDKELIKRMLENLINNSVIHNPQGCVIAVSLKRKQYPVLTKYTLELSDNGRGASKEQLRRFNARMKSNKLPEHGLGIRLVRQIAAFHHWRVQFKKSEEGGFCCQIAL